MKKLFLILFTVLIGFAFISCGNDSSVHTDWDMNSAYRRIEQVAEAVKNNDKEKLKGLFSVYITEDNDFDADIDSFMEYIKGRVVSYEIEETPVAFDYSEREGQRKKLMYWGTLCTDEETYSLFFVDFPTDTIDEENEGLYTLRIIKDEKVDMLEGTMEDWATPGIYVWDL